MGVRFACHACGRRLNVKQQLAGRRGKCPGCGAWLRIPTEDAATSLPADSSQERAQPPGGQGTRGGQGASEPGPVASHPGHPAAPAPQAPPAPPVSPPAPPDDPLHWLRADPAAQWYVHPRGGGQYGPADAALLRQWIAEDRIAADSLLWRNGWPQWRAARDVLPALFGSPATAAPPVAMPPAASPRAAPPAAPSTTAAPRPTPAAPAAPFVAPGAAAPTPAPVMPAAAARQPEAPGQVRRRRSHRRAMTIGLLLAASVLLLGVLAVVLINR